MSESDKDAIYTYNAIDLEREENDSAYIQFIGDKMYSISYEYDDETYSATQYCNIFDLNGKLISKFVVPQEVNENSSESIGQLVVISDSEYYGVKYLYVNGTDEATGDWIWDEYYSLVKMDIQGNEIWEVPLGSTGSKQMEEGDQYYGINRLFCDDNGNVWVADTASFTCYDKDGNKLSSIENSENGSGDIFLTKKGNMIVGKYNDSWGIEYYELDIMNGKISEKPIKTPESFEMYSMYSGGDSKWDVYAINGLEICAFNWGDEKMTKIMDFMLSDFDGLYVNNIQVLSDDTFLASYSDMDYNSRVASFKKVPKEEVVDKYIMTLASYYIDNDVKRQIVEFNRSHEDVRITLIDYSSYNSDENWELGMETLKNDILNGNIPDILVSPSGFDLGMYVDKGLFVDLYTLMDKDATMNKDDYLTNIIALGEYDGKLYELIPRFSAVTFSGRRADIGDRFSWTFDDVDELMNKKGEGVTLFPEDTSRLNVLYYGINMAFDQFYDSSTGNCYFNTPEFAKYLELANQYPEDVSYLWDDENYYINSENQWRDGKTVLRYEWLTSFRNYMESSQGYFGEPISYVGFPTKEASGSAIYSDFTFSIANESAFKDEAWEYISYFMKDEYQDKVEGNFPIKLSSLDKRAEKEMQPITWVDEATGEVVEEENYFWIGDKEIILQLPTKEECQYVIDFLKTIDYRQKDVSEITAIIEEDAAAYFSGQKTAEQVADTIQSRVKIYVSEKR